MSLASDVKSLVAAFEKENPDYKGKAYLTSGDRTWEEQLNIILEPKRKDNYLNIKKRFLKEFELDELPAKRSDLEADQLAWWKKEIMAQAGKPDGFAHVGGKAQDVSVKNLDKDGKAKLKETIEAKLSILMEKVTGTESVYGVTIDAANVFHCY
jgi:hypothetical protein